MKDQGIKGEGTSVDQGVKGEGRRWGYLLIVLVFLGLGACMNGGGGISLVPDKPGRAPNYWCTWYWQNYLIRKGEPVTDPDPAAVFSNQAAREQMNEENIFGKDGMAVVMIPRTRGDFYFLIDHGWQDKRITAESFFSLVMDTLDFPRYAGLEPKDRLKRMNEDIKALGWRGLGIWVRGNPPEEEIRKFVEWSRYAGIEYWKIDGGDTQHYFAEQVKKEIYPELTLEQVTGAGPLTPWWNRPGLIEYPSGYNPEVDSARAAKALEIIQKTDVFRTYDAAPLLVSATTLQRVHDILSRTAGNPEYRALLNIQDDCTIAAALGLVVATKRHPMKTPRMYKGKDLHFQITGDRHVDRRLNEMDRFARWQRIAPPMPAGYGIYRASMDFLIDSILFDESDTWFQPTYGKMVRQGAPAVMARNIDLPRVECTGLKPYVMASRFPNRAVCIATEGRVTPQESWIHPRAGITLSGLETGKPIGIFGLYKSLTLIFKEELPADCKVWAQDLLAERATDITGQIRIEGNKLIISGKIIDRIGTSSGDPGDISVPGMVIRVER
jgi:hypothetical protein